MSLGLAGALLIALVGPQTAGANAAPAPEVTSALRDRSVHVVAAGDIASDGGGQARTAKLVAALKPARVLAVGDLAYPTGSAAQFERLYAPTWGSFRSITLAVPGNHEYRTPRAGGFRQYFGLGSRATWRAWRAAGWLIVGLDSEQAASDAQIAWLRSTLSSHNGLPTVVFWHRPRFSSGAHGDQKDTDRLWRTVSADRDVRLLIWGHDHDVERMRLPSGGRTLTAFVVGTGGAELRPMRPGAPATHRRFFMTGAHGVLDLQLRPRSFSWAWVRVDGRRFDQGTQRF